MAFIKSRKTKTGETYRVGYYADGKTHWTPTLATAEGAVEIKELIEKQGPALALAILDRRDGRDHRSAPLLSEMLDVYLELSASHVTDGTIDDNRRMAERTWMPSLGPLPVDAITPEDVQLWVGRMRKQETARSIKRRERALEQDKPVPAKEFYKPKSIRNAHGLLSVVLKTAVDSGSIDRNPAYGVALPADEPMEKEIATQNEFVRLYDAMQDHYKPLTYFLCETGLRIGEASALQVRDLSLDESDPSITITRAWKKGAGTSRVLGAPKSRRSSRTLLISQPLADMLREITKGKGAQDYVFTTVQGNVINPSRFNTRQWQKALAKAGLDKHLTPHSMRHTSASWLLMAGEAPQVVQHRLGHESLATTSKTYAHLLTGAQKGSAAFMALAMSGVTPKIEGADSED